jgi:hypothetical protein
MLPVDRREWLGKNGFTTGARGRFSSVMWDAMDEAEKNGVVFLDKKAGPIKVGTTLITDENGDAKLSTGVINEFAPHRDPIRINARYTFVSDSGKKLSLAVAEACSNCLYSLGWCYCDVPMFRRNEEVYYLADSE